ncbi:MAG: ion channel [Chthoniobacterales bacterium]
MKKNRNPVSVRAGHIEFLKLNAERWEWRDAYQWMLGLTWPQFALVVGTVYLTLNVLFGALYYLGGDCVAHMRPGSMTDAFFFSVQTLATVGYGNMYPSNLYSNVITTVEIMGGLFLLAVMTGLIFVRFSRPTARIVFSRSVVIAPLNGKPTLMLRIGNLRHRSMIEAEFRIIFNRDEPLEEGGDFRYFYNLKLQFDRMPTFPAALTLRHVIDENSPLYGVTAELLEKSRAVIIASVVGIDPVIPASVQTQQDYTWNEVHFDQRFVEMYTDHGDGRLTVDYARLHDLEPV